jgi:hypothetical protein
VLGQGSGAFDVRGRVRFGQADQALQSAQAVHSAMGKESLGPHSGVRTNQPAAIQPIRRSTLDAAALVAVDVRIGGGEAAGLNPGMSRHGLQSVIENADHPRLAANPDLAAEILRRHRIVGPVELNMTIAMHLATRLGKARKQRIGQGRQSRALRRKQRTHLLAHRPMNAGVGNRALPLRQELVLIGQGAKRTPLQSVVLSELDACFDLALVLGPCRLGRQYDGPVVPGKLRHLRIERWIEPVGFEDRRLQIVYDGGARDSAKVSVGVLTTANERLGILPPDRLAVALARMTEHGTKQVRAPTFALLIDDRSALAKIHLHLFAGRALDATMRQLQLMGQAMDATFDRLVTPSESVIAHQVLVDALGRKPRSDRRRDHRQKLPAQTDSSCLRPGGRNGWVWFNLLPRAGGRNGWIRIADRSRPGGRNGRF